MFQNDTYKFPEKMFPRCRRLLFFVEIEAWERGLREIEPAHLQRKLVSITSKHWSPLQESFPGAQSISGSDKNESELRSGLPIRK
jgi:hypothetical protein